MNLADFLKKYEETNRQKSNQKAALVTGPNAVDLKARLAELQKSQNNSFRHIRFWVKAEIYEIEAMLEAVAQKE